MRILGMKAALKLHTKKENNDLQKPFTEVTKIVGNETFSEIERKCAKDSLTLVKNRENVFPIDVKKTNRVYLYAYAEGRGFGNNAADLSAYMKKKLNERGFEVTCSCDEPIAKDAEYSKTVAKYDLILYEQGLLSEGRLNEAVTRILGLKASMGLLNTEKNKIVPPADGLEILGSKESVECALQCADQAITLVKDTQEALPLSPEKTKRVLLEILGDFPSNERVANVMKTRLEKEGFLVEIYEKEGFGKNDFSVSTFRNKYDLVLYLGNVENASNKVTTG